MLSLLLFGDEFVDNVDELAISHLGISSAWATCGIMPLYQIQVQQAICFIFVDFRVPI